jgi:hypothetical protein
MSYILKNGNRYVEFIDLAAAKKAGHHFKAEPKLDIQIVEAESGKEVDRAVWIDNRIEFDAKQKAEGIDGELEMLKAHGHGGWLLWTK